MPRLCFGGEFRTRDESDVAVENWFGYSEEPGHNLGIVVAIHGGAVDEPLIRREDAGFFEILDQSLGTRRFLAGDQYSIADISALCAVDFARFIELTPDPRRRALRALLAAQGKHQAGAPEAALRLLAVAQAGPLDDLDRARAQLLHAQITFAT